ncbi:Phospho-N-acetylmuramoyl-pentapeptide-transferase [Brevinematales bacterium NS]|nr:Phospho-N-acetylmuramoyl-pentapeptide-transferase [Brevinematales bacterium NS]
MLYYLLYPLREWFFGFNLLKYITFRSLMAFFTAFLLGVIIAPFFIRRFSQIGVKQAIRDDGPQTHLVKAGTPTMGGIFVMVAVLVSLLLWGMPVYYVWVTALAIVLFGLIGFLDDYLKVRFRNSKGITEGTKFFMQVGVSLLLAVLVVLNPDPSQVLLFYVPIYDKPVFVWPLWLGIAFYVFTMVAFSNATNLSDGLDGLASGMGIILYIPFGIFAYVIGNAIAAQYLKFPYLPGAGELAVVIAALIGGYTAFLWYNVHPAEVFMGDTGSLPMGGTIALIAIFLKQEVLLVIAGGMFVLETVSVLLQRSYFKWTKHTQGTGKRIFLMAPIHHHFEKKGWKETQVVIRFWILAALCALASLAFLKIR